MNRPSIIEINHYRADLDGLRAVAVLLVVIFHAYPHKLPGGLMGVDLFFVLSGYFISQLLFRQSKLTISYIFVFYARRLQRLYPPLLLFLFSMMLLAWWRFDLVEYNALWIYLFSALTFTTNIWLAIDTGAMSDFYAHNPFLHLWSLGIEAQFYLLWPWLLWGTRRYYLVVLGTVFVVSLASVWWLTELGADSWVFYAPNSRLFEMTAGAAVAYWQLQPKVISTRLVHYVGWVVLLLMGLGVWQVRAGAVFPNVWTLLVVLATGLYIYTPHGWLNNVLSRWSFVYLGRISYSWYLWHWGLLALYQDSVSPVVLIGLSLLVAGLSYQYVELPLKKRRRLDRELCSG